MDGFIVIDIVIDKALFLSILLLLLLLLLSLLLLVTKYEKVDR